jgi:ferric-dicitrate binding protein FerR (iron transport regulator)
MDYLAGKLSGADKHEVEKWMNENEFVNEAMEGLQSVTQPEQVPLYIQQLHKQLSKQLGQTSRRHTYKVKINLIYALMAIAIILVLTIVAFMVIHRLK